MSPDSRFTTVPKRARSGDTKALRGDREAHRGDGKALRGHSKALRGHRKALWYEFKALPTHLQVLGVHGRAGLWNHKKLTRRLGPLHRRVMSLAKLPSARNHARSAFDSRRSSGLGKSSVERFTHVTARDRCFVRVNS